MVGVQNELNKIFLLYHWVSETERKSGESAFDDPFASYQYRALNRSDLKIMAYTVK